MVKLANTYYESPRWTGEILDCTMPMTFDTYSNCAFRCIYCFAFFQRSLGLSAKNYMNYKVSSVNVEKVKRMFTDPNQFGGQFAWYIKQRRVMQWGGMSDAFDYYEKKFRVSLELLKFFKEINYPISISTKGTWFLKDPEYIKVFEGAKNIHIKISIITMDEAKSKKIERGVSTPADRFAALKQFNEMGIPTTLRFRPFIPFISSLDYEEMINQAALAGCKSVTTEWFCLERRAKEDLLQRYKLLSDIAGVDMLQYYRNNTQYAHGLLRLNYEVKRPYIEHMQKLCNEQGMDFFVSDSHHAEKNPQPNCCGVPVNKNFPNHYRGHFKHALLIAKEKGFVQFSDIEEEAKNFDSVNWGNATGYNQGNSRNRAKREYQSMFSYIKEMWNMPRSSVSPAKYFAGVLVPDIKLDENGDIVYLYNYPMVEQGHYIKSVAELRDYIINEKGIKL